MPTWGGLAHLCNPGRTLQAGANRSATRELCATPRPLIDSYLEEGSARAGLDVIQRAQTAEWAPPSKDLSMNSRGSRTCSDTGTWCRTSLYHQHLLQVSSWRCAGISKVYKVKRGHHSCRLHCESYRKTKNPFSLVKSQDCTVMQQSHIFNNLLLSES